MFLLSSCILGHILDLYCIWLSNTALFVKINKTLFWCTALWKGIEKGREWNLWSPFFKKSALFFIKNIECCPKFLEYALILFCCTNQKNVLQNKIKDWTFEVYLLIEVPSSWSPLIESLKMTSARSSAFFLNFLSKGRGFGLFFVA